MVVFDQHINIFSVKNIGFKEEDPKSLASRRWLRKAVDESVRQIDNAERWIRRGVVAYTCDKGKSIDIPDLKRLKIHRVAVALGSKRKVGIPSCDFGKGFVHVFDEESLFTLLRELDTVTDFVDYLDAVER